MIYYFSEINNKYNFMGGDDMRFREVERNMESVERLSEKKAEPKFKQIKPETEITYEEACKFWDNLFSHEIPEE